MSWEMPNFTIPSLTLITTIALAFIGYFVTYLNSLRLERQKAHLAFLGDQLHHLYGPLFSLNCASRNAWRDFRSRCRPGKAFFGISSDQPTPEELSQWRLWMTEVFMPLNLQMEKVIVENAHLIEGSGMPDEFLEFLSHVEVYKVVIRRWIDGDFAQHTAYINFPDKFGPYVTETYTNLKSEQARLLKT